VTDQAAARLGLHGEGSGSVDEQVEAGRGIAGHRLDQAEGRDRDVHGDVADDEEPQLIAGTDEDRGGRPLADADPARDQARRVRGRSGFAGLGRRLRADRVGPGRRWAFLVRCRHERRREGRQAEQDKHHDHQPPSGHQRCVGRGLGIVSPIA
jgi:hypothetical protein